MACAFFPLGPSSSSKKLLILSTPAASTSAAKAKVPTFPGASIHQFPFRGRGQEGRGGWRSVILYPRLFEAQSRRFCYIISNNCRVATAAATKRSLARRCCPERPLSRAGFLPPLTTDYHQQSLCPTIHPRTAPSSFIRQLYN